MQKVSVVVCDANCGREGKSANARWRCLAAAPAADGGRRPFIKLCFSTITAALRMLCTMYKMCKKSARMCKRLEGSCLQEVWQGHGSHI